MAQPPLTIVEIQPREAGFLIYMPCVPMKQGEIANNMLAFYVDIRNGGPTEVGLTQIGVVLIRTAPHFPVGHQFARDSSIDRIGAGRVKRFYLATSESIAFTSPIPVSARVSVKAQGFDEAVDIALTLAPQLPSVEEKSYRFFSKAKDLGPDEYWVPGYPHQGGKQHFCHDFGITGWNEEENKFRENKPGTTGTRNEHKRCFGKPVYAMAEGIVIRANDTVDENPRVGWRAFPRNAEALDEAAESVAIAAVSTRRQVTAVRTTTGRLKLTVWERSTDGKHIEQRGSVTDGSIGDLVAIAPLSSSRVATVVSTVAGTLQVQAWDISGDLMTITGGGRAWDIPGNIQATPGGDTATVASVGSIAIVGLNKNLFVTTAQTADGNLKLISWTVSNDGTTVKRGPQHQAGAISGLAACKMTDSRIATAVRESAGKLKIILWDVAADGTLTHGSSVTEDPVSIVSITALGKTRLSTAVRTDAGNLKVTIWDLDADDGISATAENEGDKVSIIAIAPINFRVVATLVRSAEGTLKAILWNNKESTPSELDRLGEASGGLTDRISACAVADDFITAAVRTASGQLKVIVWEMLRGGGNVLWLLHGKELVLYGHLMKGSIKAGVTPGTTVVAGEELAKVGNTGQSSGPHIHIWAVRVPDGTTVADLIAHSNAGVLNDVAESYPYRPFVFHRLEAVQASQLKKGASIPFSTAEGDGFYWSSMAVLPD